jgi:hypothetical protein
MKNDPVLFWMLSYFVQNRLNVFDMKLYAINIRICKFIGMKWRLRKLKQRRHLVLDIRWERIQPFVSGLSWCRAYSCWTLRRWRDGRRHRESSAHLRLCCHYRTDGCCFRPDTIQWESGWTESAVCWDKNFHFAGPDSILDEHQRTRCWSMERTFQSAGHLQLKQTPKGQPENDNKRQVNNSLNKW